MRVMFPAAGFEIVRMETDWYHDPAGEDKVRNRAMTELLRQRGLSLELREDCLYTIGRKTGPVVDRWPRGLYES
jgi:hypothetical protein